jgi:hypothetical protein
MNEWVATVNSYRYRRQYEQAGAEPAPAEARPHEWRVVDSAVRMAAGDRGVLQRCRNCNAQQILIEGESGPRRILRDSEVGEFCPVR